MKIIGILGSARDGGNTDLLMQEIMKGAVKENEKRAATDGINAKTYNLAKMNIGCCLGCESCRKNGGCVRNDDMKMLYEELKNADAIVIGTPIYMGEMTGQLKTFIDRCYALKDAERNPLIPTGIKMAVVITQGAPMPEHYAKTPERIEYIFSGLGCVSVGTVTAIGTHEKDDVLKDDTVLEKAREIGRQLTI